ncbi:diguanylate cyclase family protein [Alloalcanivorax mobilis]|uniref:hypothetical protein n=1 Tax=Alloalcanivorax mobilis TaxID=2019569 RepID=UPI000B5B0F3D|nr:hypothetical protein [Alloalcanivorax mobilis]ASK35852.1 hypothetical protein CEK62_16410 [Alcanivorax sp. N3-2A]
MPASRTVETRQRARSWLTYLALLAGIMPAWPGVSLLGTGAALVAVTLAWRELRVVARCLLTLVAVSTLAALVLQPATLISATTGMLRLTALIVTMMLLAALLSRSADLQRISTGLFSGTPLKRYYSITFGTGFLSVPLNFGSVGVIGTLVGDRIRRHGDSAMAGNAARGMLRGYGASPMFSPLSISVVTTLIFLPTLHSWELLAVSFPLAMLYLLAGALFRDRESGPMTPVEGAGALWPWLRFAAVVGGIWGGALLLSALAGLGYSKAVTLSGLVAVILLMLARRAAGDKAGLPTMAPLANEITIMGGSAFLGVMASAVVLHVMGGDMALPGWGYPLVAFVVPWVFFGAGLLGLNPIIVGTLVGGVFGPIWPPSAHLALAVAMVCGWAQSAAGTPYSANSLLLERLTGYDARVAALRWNLGLSLCSLVVGASLAALLTVCLSGLI